VREPIHNGGVKKPTFRSKCLLNPSATNVTGTGMRASGARILLAHHTIARCNSGGAGCKCVSCYNLDGSVYSACYPLVTPIPGR
jgi:hypothetical protein